jgi:cobalt/nickel transport protein
MDPIAMPSRLLALVVLGCGAAVAQAHFHMLLPESPSVKRGEAVPIVCRWGHPFEAQLFDADMPQQFFALGPDGARTDLLKSLMKEAGLEKVGYRLRFTPEQRGDYVLVANHVPIWMEEDSEFLQDTVKVILHVQAQKGWDASAGQAFEMMPLTRPYALRAGSVFQAQVISDGKPLAGALCEIERRNTKPPRSLPPDEQITATAKTDPNGVLTCTLPEPGWWCLTAQRDGGMKEHNGKNHPIRRRTTLWVYIDPKPEGEPQAPSSSPRGGEKR